jgi:hypothetical protein
MHGEPGHGDQPDEDQADDRDREHDDRRIDPVRVHRCHRGRTGREPEAGKIRGRGVEQHGHPARGGYLPRRDQCEVVEQTLRVLDDSDDPQLTARVRP